MDGLKGKGPRKGKKCEVAAGILVLFQETWSFVRNVDEKDQNFHQKYFRKKNYSFW